jgi:hypothetical protein
MFAFFLVRISYYPFSQLITQNKCTQKLSSLRSPIVTCNADVHLSNLGLKTDWVGFRGFLRLSYPAIPRDDLFLDAAAGGSSM